MKVTDDHWLDVAIRKHTPGGAPMLVRRFLINHFTAGASALSSIEFAESIGLSCHLWVDRDGKIYQQRPFNRVCYHAGKSQWKDPNTGKLYTNLNSCAIGVEFANGGDIHPERFSKLEPVVARHKNGGNTKKWERYTPQQIEKAKEIARVLKERYNLDDVIGHDDIAPNRKSDPGPAFPMAEVRKAAGLNPEIKR